MANINAVKQGDGDQQGCSASMVIFAILSFIVTCICTFAFIAALAGERQEPIGTGIIILMAVPSLLTGSIAGALGAAIGDLLRRIACPEAIFTTGGMGELLKQKLFWAIGPQLIGIVVGSVIGVQLWIALIKAVFKL